MITIRINGSWNEVKRAQKLISDAFKVLSVSQPYPDRGQADNWRVYINCDERSNKDEANN